MAEETLSEPELTKLKDDIVDNFRQHIGEAWEKMTKQDKDLLESLAKDAAKLHWKNLASSNPSLETEIKIVNASLLNFTIAKYFPMKQVFWHSVERAATVALSVLVKSAIGAVAAL